MKYYQVRDSAESKVIGVYPQVQESEVLSVNHPDYIGRLLFEQPATSSTLVAKPILARRAKLTDLLSVSSMGFTNRLLISDKLKVIIEVGDTTDIQFLPTSLITRKSEEPFWIVNPVKFHYEFIDYEKSEILLYPGPFSKDPVIQHIADEDHLRRRLNELGEMEHLSISKIRFRTEVSADFFAVRLVPPSGLGYFVSESLKTAIEREACIGIVFIPV